MVEVVKFVNMSELNASLGDMLTSVNFLGLSY